MAYGLAGNGKEIRDGFDDVTVPGVVPSVYSPIVPLVFVTKRSDPDTAMPLGANNPVTKEAFTVAPEVVNSPIVPRPFVKELFVTTNKSDPDAATATTPLPVGPGVPNPDIR